MLSLAEYQGYVNDITILGQNTDQQIADETSGLSKGAAINQAQNIAGQYMKDFGPLMNQALLDIAANSLYHYKSQIDQELPEDLIRSVIKDQYRHRYYGATLQQRLILMRLRLNRVVTQTAQTGLPNLGGLFSNSIPFGAQTNISKRLLQGTAIKVEQDVARKVATQTDTPMIRWTLAKEHVHHCQCEVLAKSISKDVTKYLEDHNLDIKPEGLFFVDDLPDPPHPNCQCEFNLVGGGEIVPSRSYRPFHRLRRLIRKLFRS